MIKKNSISSEDKEIKCIVIGDSSVGKSCIISRYINNTFNSQTLSTLGAMYHTKIINHKDINYKINIWDTAGQDIYKNVTSLYYRDTQVALVVFSCTNDDSKNSVFRWINDILEKNKEKIVIYIICNKIDLKLNYKINSEFLEKCKNKNYKIFYTSAKDNIGLSDIYNGLIDDVIKTGIENDNLIIKRTTCQIKNNPRKKKKKGCC